LEGNGARRGRGKKGGGVWEDEVKKKADGVKGGGGRVEV